MKVMFVKLTIVKRIRVVMQDHTHTHTHTHTLGIGLVLFSLNKMSTFKGNDLCDYETKHLCELFLSSVMLCFVQYVV